MTAPPACHFATFARHRAIFRAGGGRETEIPTPAERLSVAPGKKLGQAIFIAHGKNEKSLEELKRILD
jgi:hypothetical protein